MDWGYYVREQLEKNSCLKNIEMTINNNVINVPNIINISIDLINRSISSKGNMVIVFPEQIYSIFLTVILKVVVDILEENINKTYDVELFKKGQKLKLQNAIVEFDRVEIEKDIKRIYVKTADCTTGIPLDLAPFFQLTDTNRHLSKTLEFDKSKKAIKVLKITDANCSTSILLYYKTHINKSIYYITSIGKSKNFLENTNINSKNIKDLLLIGQVDFEGNINKIGKGQFDGIPSIVLASDLYEVNEAIKKGSKIEGTEKLNFFQCLQLAQ